MPFVITSSHIFSHPFHHVLYLLLSRVVLVGHFILPCVGVCQLMLPTSLSCTLTRKSLGKPPFGESPQMTKGSESYLSSPCFSKNEATQESVQCPGLGGLRRGYSLWVLVMKVVNIDARLRYIKTGSPMVLCGQRQWVLVMKKTNRCDGSLRMSPLSFSPNPYLSLACLKWACFNSFIQLCHRKDFASCMGRW